MVEVEEKEQIATAEQIEMIEEFQCPGCTCGGDTECEAFKFHPNDAVGCYCSGHSAGTFIVGIGKIALGLPKGFDRVGTIRTGFEGIGGSPTRSTNIRLIVDVEKMEKYDSLNVPVWAMEKDGYLFVRVMCPRINYTYVDIIKGGKFKEICPQAFNVAK